VEECYSKNPQGKQQCAKEGLKNFEALREEVSAMVEVARREMN